MKNVILLSLLALLIGCSNNKVNDVNDDITPPVVVEDVEEPRPDHTITCVHSYERLKTFIHSGNVKRYQEQMFGRMVYVYEYVLVDGKIHRLSGDELENYKCEVS